VSHVEQPDFKELIAKLWNTPSAFTDPLDICQFKIRLVRKKVKGWALNINAQVRKQKLELLKEYDLLDLKYENFVITEMERNRMKEIVKDLESIWKLEEIKARQRARDRNVKEGDRNTAYFQAVANQRNRKKRISGLEGPDGWIDDNKGMLEHAVDFYRKLFGKEEDSGVKLGQDFGGVDEKVTALENELLEAPFTENEVREAVFSSYAEGAPGPDGLSFLFYQKFWNLIKADLIDMFNDFFKGDLDLSRLNFSLVTLIPKVGDATNMKQFRPISLLNCSFKIFSKFLTIRLGPISQRIVNNSQSAIIKGKYILESVVVAHELVHSLNKSGEQGVILKLDFEKAYDRVSWQFLFDMLRDRNFDPLWIKWIQQIVVGGSLGILVNGEESSFFKPGKGLRQGDPLSPLLFNLVGDGLSRMIDRAVDRGLVKGLLGDFRRGGIVSLQYADDTILFSKAEESALENLKCILMWYEQLSGMKVNFHKSELVPMNLDLDDAQRFAQIFSCPVGSFHLKYLGVPLHFGNLSRDDIQPLVDKILKRIAGWRGKLLSLAARAMLIQTCLASIPVYLLSFIKFPKLAVKLLNTHMANCLWNDSVDNHKYHLANWEMVSMCKEFGGLGIPNLRDLNICLLGSWLKRYNSDKEKLWKELIDFKYNTQKPNIFQSRSSGASNFFKGFMWAAQAAKMGYRWKVGNGRKLRLWEDNWLGSSSLAIQFWPLYRIFNEKCWPIGSPA